MISTDDRDCSVTLEIEEAFEDTTAIGASIDKISHADQVPVRLPFREFQDSLQCAVASVNVSDNKCS